MAQQQRPAETLSRLMVVSKEIDRLQLERERLVAAARSEHQSWRAIADALGVSRQAAWKAHRTAATTVEQIRSRSELTDAEAVAAAGDALREVRQQRSSG